jgi:osmoprotectant transport system substrate-binding protein
MRTSIRSILALLVVLILALGVAACGSDDDEGDNDSGGEQSSEALQSNSANEKVSITVGSKNFTEQKVLGEIYEQALSAVGYRTKGEFNLGDEKVALKSLEDGQIDAYPEYTGTALLSFFEVDTKDLPKDAQAAYQQVKSDFQKDQITALPPTPFTSSNEVGITQETAEKLGNPTKISDLEGKDQDLVLYGSPECRQRDDCLLGLQEVYGLDFRQFKPVAIDLRHEVLEKGQADVSIVFTTDPQNERNKVVLLEDDKNMFPPYNSTLLVRDETVREAGPDLEKTVVKVNEGLTDEVMQELNARVDLDKKTPQQVASEYLKESGLVE